MFEVRLKVEDRDLPKVLWLLDTVRARDLAVIPVRGAKAAGLRRVISSQPIPGAPIVDQVAAMIGSAETDIISYGQLAELIVQAGGKASSRVYVGQKLIQRKILVKGKSRGDNPHYKIRRS